MTDEPRDAFDTFLDAVVYAPIGAVLHGPEAVEQLAAKGRQDVTNARFIGKLAIQRARREVDAVAAEAQQRIGDLLAAAARAAGAPMPDAGSDDHDDSAPASADGSHLTVVPDAADPAETDGDDAPSAEGGTAPVHGDLDGTRAEGPAADDTDADGGQLHEVPDADSLAIPDYDNLAASQVVPRLDDLGADELAAVQVYERANRGRMTILSRIAQLQAS